jgi:hypothetical protein
MTFNFSCYKIVRNGIIFDDHNYLGSSEQKNTNDMFTKLKRIKGLFLPTFLRVILTTVING